MRLIVALQRRQSSQSAFICYSCSYCLIIAVSVSLALSPDHGSLLSKLIVVDIAPSKGAISPDFANYLKAMRKVQAAAEEGTVKTRKDADGILAEYESVIRCHSLWHNQMLIASPVAECWDQTMADDKSTKDD